MTPKNLVRSLLHGWGYNISATTPDADIRDFLRRVRPTAIPEQLIRVGARADGGYLLPDNLDGIAACFSPGVGPSASFELQLAHRGIRSFMADFSVPGPPVQHALFDFERTFLGARNDDRFIRLEDWVNRKRPAPSADLLLQMDIEGGEYEVILDTPPDLLRRFRIIAVEFHRFDMMFDRHAFGFLNLAFEKLLRDFAVVHIHPNNCCPIVSNGSFATPPVVEFTFYRKDHARPTGEVPPLPHPLDARCREDHPEIALPACWLNDA